MMMITNEAASHLVFPSLNQMTSLSSNCFFHPSNSKEPNMKEHLEQEDIRVL